MLHGHGGWFKKGLIGHRYTGQDLGGLVGLMFSVEVQTLRPLRGFPDMRPNAQKIQKVIP